MEVLGPAGALAAAVPHYEDRPEQRRMAQAVERALVSGRLLLAEAGTGTGKTLAYLVPALTSGKRVVVSTGTRVLQEQIARHDLPLLASVLPQPFVAVTLKGMANYACRRLAAQLGRHVPDDLRDDAHEVLDWIDHTVTGDRAEVERVADDSRLWPLVTVTPETRIGPRCEFFDRCFVTQARRRAEQANLILVNHHLFFADLALKTHHPSARVLPDYDAVIFDEGHQLEEVVTEHFGVRVSTARLQQLSRDARQLLTGARDATLWTGLSSAAAILEHLERSAAQLFLLMRSYLGIAAGDAARIELAGDLFSRAEHEEAWFRLDSALHDLSSHSAGAASDADDERQNQLEAMSRRCEFLRTDLALLVERSAHRYVYWGELRGAHVSLCASPVDVGDIVKDQVIPRLGSAVITSATLSVAGRFDYLRGRLGLTELDVDELAVASAFDYARQALLYLPQDLPLPSEAEFLASACARICALLAITDGRAFVLFTSHRNLADAARRLRGGDYPLWVQGQAPRAQLLQRFRATPRSVLLATGSFWEGVDVPGDALSQVIIDKLPFSPPTDPLLAARMRRVEESGASAFDDYLLPRAALALKQGFGRLIRRCDDRGIVTVLDRRIVTRAYGQTFLDSLPVALRRTSSIEQARRWWSAA